MKTLLSALSLVLLSTSLVSAIDPDKANRPGGYNEQAHSLKSLLTPGDGYCPPNQARNSDGHCEDIAP